MRVEVKVGRFFEYEEDAIKKERDIEFHTIVDFLRGFTQRAAEKLVLEHKFDVNTVGEALDCILKWNKRDKEKPPSEKLNETVQAEAENA